ncbi:MAG: tetratricopeptide repeat protein [Thermodesulfovibrionales bacterium]|jgi:TolA-binding protein
MSLKGLCRIILLAAAVVIALTSLAYAQEETYDKALRAYLKKDFKTTVKYLKEYVAQNPDADAYYLLGYANYKLKNRKDAIGYFREAYLIDPNFTPKSIEFKGTVKKSR